MRVFIFWGHFSIIEIKQLAYRVGPKFGDRSCVELLELFAEPEWPVGFDVEEFHGRRRVVAVDRLVVRRQFSVLLNIGIICNERLQYSTRETPYHISMQTLSIISAR